MGISFSLWSKWFCPLIWSNSGGIVLTFKFHSHCTVVKEPCGSGKLVSLRKRWILIAAPSAEGMLLKQSNRTDDNHKTSRPTPRARSLKKKKISPSRLTHHSIYEGVAVLTLSKWRCSSCNVTGKSWGAGVIVRLQINRDDLHRLCTVPRTSRSLFVQGRLREDG